MSINSRMKLKGYYILIRVDLDAVESQLREGEKIVDGHIVTASGIVTEAIDNERLRKGSQTGTVVQLGELAYKTAEFTTGNWCEVGDKVFFKRYDGIAVDGEIFGEKGVHYMLLNDSDVIAVIKK